MEALCIGLFDKAFSYAATVSFFLLVILFLILRNGTLMSSKIKYKQGTNTKVSKVANNTAKPNATAIGVTKRACKLVSNMIGNTPANVVIEVRVIARKRAHPASITASLIATPRALAWLT